MKHRYRTISKVNELKYFGLKTKFQNSLTFKKNSNKLSSSLTPKYLKQKSYRVCLRYNRTWPLFHNLTMMDSKYEASIQTTESSNLKTRKTRICFLIYAKGKRSNADLF